MRRHGPGALPLYSRCAPARQPRPGNIGRAGCHLQHSCGGHARADCQRIAHQLSAYEFPWDFQRALELALCYTYGSASVSRLLDGTGEFRTNGQKRYDDTRLLITHLIDAGWDGEVGRRAAPRARLRSANPGPQPAACAARASASPAKRSSARLRSAANSSSRARDSSSSRPCSST